MIENKFHHNIECVIDAVEKMNLTIPSEIDISRMNIMFAYARSVFLACLKGILNKNESNLIKELPDYYDIKCTFDDYTEEIELKRNDDEGLNLEITIWDNRCILSMRGDGYGSLWLEYTPADNYFEIHTKHGNDKGNGRIGITNNNSNEVILVHPLTAFTSYAYNCNIKKLNLHKGDKDLNHQLPKFLDIIENTTSEILFILSHWRVEEMTINLNPRFENNEVLLKFKK